MPAAYDGRHSVKQQVVSLLEAAVAATSGDTPDLSAVTVHYTDAGDERGSSSITCGHMKGAVEQRGYGGNRTPRQDVFDLALIVEVREQPDAETGDAACEQIVDLIETTFLAAPYLDIAKSTVHPSEKDGPNPYRSEQGGAYLLSQAVVTLRIQVNL